MSDNPAAFLKMLCKSRLRAGHENMQCIHCQFKKLNVEWSVKLNNQSPVATNLPLIIQIDQCSEERQRCIKHKSTATHSVIDTVFSCFDPNLTA